MTRDRESEHPRPFSPDMQAICALKGHRFGADVAPYADPEQKYDVLGETNMSFCVMTPVIGNLNETYIRRHANDLVPGDTVMIALHEASPERRAWETKGPKLFLPHSCHTEGIIGGSHDGGAQICAFWKTHNVEVVLAEYLQFAVQYAPLVRNLGIRFYAHAHGFDCSALLRHERWRTRYRELTEISGIIVVSNRMKNALTELGIPDVMIQCIPYGVDVQEFLRRPDRSPHIRFLAVGRLVGKKGPIFLLDSFRRALQDNPNIELHWVGGGELFEAVIQFVDSFALGPSIKLYGLQPPSVVQQLIENCDVFVQHSVTNTSTGDEEGLPVVILEAMAGGLPVISTIHAGIPDAVVDGVTGFLVPERDTCAMADKMSIFANSYQARLEMGQKGRERIQTGFTWSHERRLLLETMHMPVSVAEMPRNIDVAAQ